MERKREGHQYCFNSMALPENNIRCLDAAAINNFFSEYYLPQNPPPPSFENHMYWDPNPAFHQNAHPNFDHFLFSTNNNVITNYNNHGLSTLGFEADHNHQNLVLPAADQLAASLNSLRISNNAGLSSNQRVPNGFPLNTFYNDKLSVQEHEYISAMLVQYRMDQYMRLSNLNSGNLNRSTNRSSSASSTKDQLGSNQIRCNFHRRNGVNRGSRGLNSMAKNHRIGNNRSAAEQQTPSYYSVSLEGLRGKIASVAKDDVWCRYLQKRIEEGKVEEIEMIFNEVMEDGHDHFRELMVDPFGTVFIQKLVEGTNKEGCTKMLDLVMSDERKLKDICTDQYGSRAMKKLLEQVQSREQQSSFMRILRRITIPLTKTQPGCFVISSCLKHFSPDTTKCVVDLVLDNCRGLAKEKYGCVLVQDSITYGYAEAKECCVADITKHARVLSEDPFGNYVLQIIIGLKLPRMTADILGQLRGYLVSLSMNKHSSNVVEKILAESGEEHVNMVVNELINSPDDFLNLARDRFGNYVAQTAIAASKGAIHSALVNLTLSHSRHLHSHIHGKWVLERAKGRRIVRRRSFRTDTS